MCRCSILPLRTFLGNMQYNHLFSPKWFFFYLIFVLFHSIRQTSLLCPFLEIRQAWFSLSILRTVELLGLMHTDINMLVVLYCNISSTLFPETQGTMYSYPYKWIVYGLLLVNAEGCCIDIYLCMHVQHISLNAKVTYLQKYVHA